MREALAVYLEAPGEGEAWARFRAARREACAAIAGMPRQYRQTSDIHTVHELVREMAISGVHDRIAEAEDLAQAQMLARKDWRAILAAMLLVPAWQWNAAPLVLEVPDWLRPDYVRWLFAAPSHFSAPGQAEAYAAFTLQRLEELVRWLKRGPAEMEVIKVLGAYASHASLSPAAGSTGDLRRHAELRGQLLRRVMALPDDRYVASARPLAGRRLRIGIIQRDFESQAETHATLPLFEELDPERFEVILFTYVNSFSLLEEYCRQKSAGFQVLPNALPAQLEMLRKAALDVVVFSTNLTAECNVVTRLALHRVAPLQVATNASVSTTGLPEIDLFLSGDLATTERSATHFTERLGCLPGPSHVFNFEVDRAEGQMPCTRADFGLSENECVFVSTANFRKITPEVQQVWARILAAVPGSSLLLHPFHSPQPEGHAIQLFHAGFESALWREGVDVARVVASTVAFTSRADVEGLVGLGDIFLDPFPFSAVEALADPLRLGLPVVTLSGGMLRSRTGASLLRSLESGDLVQNSLAGYHSLAVRLATDAVYRERCGQRLRGGMAESPVCLDSEVASRGFGELMQCAFDEISQYGRAAFRADFRPLRASAAIQ